MESDSLASPQLLHSPALTGPSVSTPSDGPDTIWTTAMEIALFRAIARHKPVGLHKHFRMMGVVEEYNRQSPIKLTAEDIWTHLAAMYDLTSLDEMAKENDQAELKWQDNNNNEHSGVEEFSLPLRDFGELLFK
ncbi:chromatin modification-related protein EAF7-domain-containing protein [Syncephalis fuscata]|nr:chromatin modification-related protein EAF7-domain-containing protein [Syncephalis fuscata]